MKRIAIILKILAILLGLASCDRFDHAFKPVAEVNFALELFTPLQAGFNAVSVDNLSPAMNFYADDYLHYGIDKVAWETMLQGYLNGISNPQFEVTLSDTELLSETSARANWRLKISDPATKAVIMDSSYVAERLVKSNNRWLLRGNQTEGGNNGGKQKVVVEYVTNIGCSYCPSVETKLHDLQAMYPDQFIYLTHQLTGPVAINDILYQYYGAFSAPTSIIQGVHKLTGGTQTELDQYEPIVANLMNVDNPVVYNLFSHQISGSTVSGSLELTLQTKSLPKTSMILNLALLEDVSTATSFSGEPLTNVVLARKRIDLTGANLAEPVEFSITDDKALPDDLSLVAFLQTTPESFANDAIIHSGLHYPLSTKGVKK
ncbi:MAG TPA: hypothetical protein PL160_03525 [Candidatus Cloacimonas sp.]|mgnify:CR=1 FL=1|nr:hypothetical protein [Candidatus Cloacimonas sp.]